MQVLASRFSLFIICINSDLMLMDKTPLSKEGERMEWHTETMICHLKFELINLLLFYHGTISSSLQMTLFYFSFLTWVAQDSAFNSFPYWLIQVSTV